MIKQLGYQETKSLQQYRSGIEFLQMHIQLLDASLEQTAKLAKTYDDQELPINKALNIDEILYNKLNHPCKQQKALIRHSRKKNIEFAIIRVFNLFTIYLRNITEEMFAQNPMLIVGKAVIKNDGDDKENLTITYADIIRLSTYEKIQNKIVNSVFRSIEGLQSTSKLLERILKDTKVNIPKTTINEALKYLEMRHLFIHNEGFVDEKYAKTYGKMFSPNLKDKKELPGELTTFTNALTAITALVKEIDAQLIQHGLVKKRKTIIKKREANK